MQIRDRLIQDLRAWSASNQRDGFGFLAADLMAAAEAKEIAKGDADGNS